MKNVVVKVAPVAVVVRLGTVVVRADAVVS